LGAGTGNKTTNNSGFRFKAPIAGNYYVKCALYFVSASIVAGNESSMILSVNNSAVSALWDIYYMATSTQPTNYNGSTEISLAQDDIVEFVFNLNLNAGPYTQTASVIYNYVIIERVG
jgi:hypothetical protein